MGIIKSSRGQLAYRRNIINKLEILVQKSERTKVDLEEKDKCEDINKSLLNVYGGRMYIEVACHRLGTSDGLLYFFPPWRNSPIWVTSSSLSRLHDHTQTHYTR
jgi:hypothetical protein